MTKRNQTIWKMLYWLGGNAVCRLMLGHRPRIVMLHKVVRDGAAEPPQLTVSMLADMLRAVKRNYVPLKLKDFVEVHQTPGACPRNAVVLTFDDGCRSFYDLVFPLLREFDVPATVFVCPRLIDERSCIWPDRLSALYAAGLGEMSGKGFEALLDEMKSLDAATRNRLLDQAQASLGGRPPQIPADHGLMDWSMLREVSRSDLVEVGSHTQTHPILACESASVARVEIYESKARLEEMLGLEVKTFSYPNGRPTDYTQDQVRMVQEAGYSGAVAAHFGLAAPGSDRFALPRIGGDSHLTPYSFFRYLDGIEHFRRKALGAS